MLLSEDGAWAIAMAWQAPLQGKVTLTVDRDGPVNTIHQSYAWIHIDTPHYISPTHGDPWKNCDPLEPASIARAAALTWLTLSRCRGYSCEENPDFWKRVFSELYNDPPRSGRGFYPPKQSQGPVISSAVGFFDQRGHRFPRFSIPIYGWYGLSENGEAMTAIFCGVPGYDVIPVIKAILDPLLERLRPFVQWSQDPEDVVDVCLVSRQGLSRYVPNVVHKINDTPRTGILVQHFCVTSLDLDEEEPLFVDTDEYVDTFLRTIQRLPVPIGHFRYSPVRNEASRQGNATRIAAFFALDGYDVQAKTTSLEIWREGCMEDEEFEGFMSALPFARSLHSLAVYSTGYEDMGTKMDTHDLPWIAYALFHPQAKTSSLRHFELYDLKVTSRAARVLDVMSRGNNLLALLNGTPPESDAYYSADLVSEAAVKTKPSDDSDTLLGGACGRVKRVDVCGIPSLDRATWDEWVAVIVPAYGFGWVRATALDDVQRHAPSVPALTGFAARQGLSSTRSPENLLHLLPTLGVNLTYLDLRYYRGGNVSPEMLHRILGWCPALKTLAICHHGELWSSTCASFDFSSLPKLEELELYLAPNARRVEPPSREQLASLQLCNLRALRIYTLTSGRLERSRAALEQVLSYASHLQYLHWRNCTLYAATISHAASLQWTSQVLEKLGLSDHERLDVQGPFSSSCTAAFLSVVATASAQYTESTGQDTETSGLARLLDSDSAVLKHIFQFATSPVRRIIKLEPEVDRADEGKSYLAMALSGEY